MAQSSAGAAAADAVGEGVPVLVGVGDTVGVALRVAPTLALGGGAHVSTRTTPGSLKKSAPPPPHEAQTTACGRTRLASAAPSDACASVPRLALPATVDTAPSATRVSTYNANHNKTSVHVQTAGSVHKRPVPFSVNAPRNRVLNEDKRRAPPFASTLDLKNGGVANSTIYPYRTIAKCAAEATAVPMEARTG
jgi:hypothetical protein